MLVEQLSIGEIRQRVMERHMRDFCFGAPAFRDVFMGGDPAAAGHRLIRDHYFSVFPEVTIKFVTSPFASSAIDRRDIAEVAFQYFQRRAMLE